MQSVRPDDKTGDILQQIAHLSTVVDIIEGRLLRLIKVRGEESDPLEDFVEELLLLAKDLRRCYRQVADLKERRDLPFKEVVKLQELDQHCVWLYRNIHLEQAFFGKMHLESKLRSLISPEAFGVYQEFQNAEEQEKEFLASDDARIKKFLLGEPT